MNTTTTDKLSAQMAYSRVLWARLQMTIAMRCANGRAGRVLLHVLCACGDHQVRWHFHGIVRELAGQFPLFN